MTANHELERRIADFYASEGQLRAPDRVLSAALTAIEHTEQRGGRFGTPWRFRTMTTYARVAVAAVAVVVAGVFGMAVLRPGSAPGPGGPVTTPSPSSVPSPTPSSSATSRPTLSPMPAPPLTQLFTSTRHGFSTSYPEGWATQAATAPWTGDALLFRVPPADYMYDPILTDHLFLAIASQPIGVSTPEEWVADKVTLEGCAAGEPIAVDGASGLIGADDCHLAAIATEGRGYLIWLYMSGDEAWLSTIYDRAWFEEVLATVQLRPEDAVDVAPSASP